MSEITQTPLYNQLSSQDQTKIQAYVKNTHRVCIVKSIGTNLIYIIHTSSNVRNIAKMFTERYQDNHIVYGRHVYSPMNITNIMQIMYKRFRHERYYNGQSYSRYWYKDCNVDEMLEMISKIDASCSDYYSEGLMSDEVARAGGYGGGAVNNDNSMDIFHDNKCVGEEILFSCDEYDI